VDQQRCGVDKLSRYIDIGGLELVYISQKLGGDLSDRNVVDIDVLLADQVQQQVEGSVVNQSHADGKGRLLRALVALLLHRCCLGCGFLIRPRLDVED